MPNITVYNDEGTLHKVWSVLNNYVSDQDALDIINELQNRGVLIGEHPRDEN